MTFHAEHHGGPLLAGDRAYLCQCRMAFPSSAELNFFQFRSQPDLLIRVSQIARKPSAMPADTSTR